MNFMIPYAMLACGAVLALIFAAGPLDSSAAIQAGFAVSICLIALGAWLRRDTGRKATQDGTEAGHMKMAHTALEKIICLAGNTPTDEQTLRTLLEEAHGHAEDLVACRQALLDGYGVGTYAQIMVAVARAERAVYRSLSALSDGYPEEAWKTFDEILPAAQEARKLLKHDH